MNKNDMTPCEIVVVGSLNTDLVASVDRFPDAGETRTGHDFNVNCGGKGANQAYGAAALGACVAMVGQVGTDDFGSVQIKNLASVGVQTNHILRAPEQPTGTAIIGLEDSGENRIIVIPGANGAFSPDRLHSSLGVIQNAKVVLLQLEIPKSTVAETLRAVIGRHAKIILDPAPAMTLTAEWYPSIHYLTPNLSELRQMTGDPLEPDTPLSKIIRSGRSLCDQGARCVIAKLGPRGAVQITSREDYYSPAVSVQALDTTAAGDCFNAAFATDLAAGRSERDAVDFAVAASSLSVTRKGAQNSMPTRDAVSTFRKQAAFSYK
jgi:ribokinase